jgi:hypothetical protein
MTLDDQVRERPSPCRQQLLTLRMLGFGQHGTALSGQAAAVRDVTNAIIAEAEAMSRTALEPGGSGQQGYEVFILVRVARLAMAADRAVTAARSGDAAALRDHLRHFDTLASALWTVHDAVSGQEA